MNKTKRIFGVLLACCIVVEMLAVSASAAPLADNKTSHDVSSTESEPMVTSQSSKSVKKKLVQQDHYLSNGVLQCTTNYEYDNQGRIISNICTYLDVSDPPVFEGFKYVYGDDGRLLREHSTGISYDDSIDDYNKLEYTYDADGKIIKYEDRYGDMYAYGVYKYDTSGKLISEEGLKYGIWRTTSYSYDSDGKLISVKAVDNWNWSESDNSTHEIITTWNFSYDDNGFINQTEKTYTDEIGSNSYTVAKYSYDLTGPLLKIRKATQDGKNETIGIQALNGQLKTDGGLYYSFSGYPVTELYMYDNLPTGYYREPYGQPLVVVSLDGNITYDDDGYPIRYVDTNGWRDEYTYAVVEPKAEDYRILIYADKPLTALRPDDYVDFRCVLSKGKNKAINWTNPSIVIDNVDMLQVSSYFDEGNNCYFTIKGTKEGTCTVTITDSATGVYGKFSLTFGNGIASTNSYRLDQVPSFNVDESAWIFGEKYTQTNFYDVSGLYVNGFTYDYNAQLKKYEISFNAYNRTYYYGAVDVYDASGRWIATEKINKVSSAHSIMDTFSDGWNLVADLAIEKKGLSYTLSSSTKETPVTISVPKGGYFTISNNYYESPGTFFFNVLDYILLAASTTFDLGLNIASGDDMKISSFQNMMKDEIFDLEKFKSDELVKAIKNYVLDASKMMTSYSLGEMVGVMTCNFEELLASLNIELDDIVKTEFSIGESAFKKLAGPFGAALSGMFSVAECGDIIVQTVALAYSSDNPYVVVYATTNPYSSATVNGVTVEADKGVIEDEAVLRVFKVKFDGNAPELNGTIVPDGQYETYNISFVKSGLQVQPNDEVTVKISIPDGYKNHECVVLRQEADGSWTRLDATIEGSVITFKTAHFSVYAIADTSPTASKVIIEDKKISLEPGSSHQINFSVEPENAAKRSIIWESRDPMIACVDNDGTVIAISAGTTEITAKTIDGYRISCTVTVEGNPFKDVLSTDWFYNAIQYVYGVGMMNGTSGTTFEPYATTTRSMAVTMLYRMENTPITGESTFPDVVAGQWYTNGVIWAATNGVVNGYNNGKFGPSDTITREQMATILFRYAQFKDYDVVTSGNLTSFTDADKVSSYAVNAIRWAVGVGLISGKGNGVLDPGGSATRAEVATIFMRFCENIVNK